MRHPSAWRLLTLALALTFVLSLIAPIPHLGDGIEPAEAAQSGCWNANYYSNTSLSGSPVWTECITPGGGGGLNDDFSPAPPIPTSNFSASYSRTVTFNSTGTYELSAFVNDGVRVFVGGQTVIDNFTDNPNPSPRTLNGQFTISSTQQTVVIQFVNFSGNPALNISWVLISGNGGTGGTGGTGGETCSTTPGFVSSWSAEYYNSTDRTGGIIATGSFAGGPLNVDYGTAAPAPGVTADNWSARFTRIVDFQPGGQVTFSMRVDDVGAVYLDGNIVTASDVVFRNETFTATINVSRGSHTVTVEMADFTDGAYIDVTWTGAETGGGGSCDTATTDDGTTIDSPTGVVGTVRARVGLNTRVCPSLNCTKITTLPQGSQWAVVGRTADNVWAQLDLRNGQLGWSLSEWLTFSGDFNSVPVTDGSAFEEELGDGVPIRAVGNVRIRDCPSLRCTRITYVPWGTRVLAFGQSSNGLWLKIGYEDPELGPVVGWSFAPWYFNDEFRLPLPELPVITD